MKSLREYSMNLPEQEYHNYPAWSYSMIAKYAKEGFSAIKKIHERVEPTASMEFGSLFDTIITKPDSFNDEYVVMDVAVPDAERKALDYISSTTSSRFEDIPKEYIYEKSQESGYQPRWGVDAKYEHLKPYSDYFNAKITGKKIVSTADYNDAVEMANIFHSDEYLKNLFGTKDTKDIEYIYQSQFLVNVNYGENKIPIKIMPDLLVVNHKDRTVQPVDLKTSSVPAYDFASNFVKFRYDIQAVLYSDVLHMIMSNDDEYRDYTLLPYLFTDISRADKVPVTYKYNPYEASQLYGFSFGNEDRKYSYKNWRTLLAEILHYEETNATVPSNISTTGPNDIISILNNQ